MAPQELLVCPFCDYTDSNDYQMLLHVEVQHSEDGASPFAVREATASTEGPKVEDVTFQTNPDLPSKLSESAYIDCPYQCGERILSEELASHTDFHVAENMTIEESDRSTGPPLSHSRHKDRLSVRSVGDSLAADLLSSAQGPRRTPPSSVRDGASRRAPTLKELFFGRSVEHKKQSGKTSPKAKGTRRLGRAELGPYAHEKRMPMWLEKMLAEGPKITIANKIGPSGTLVRVETIANETSNLVPVLARLSVLDDDIARAFYCNSAVHYVAKMPREGGFCGYRNIHMLISYIQNTKAPGHQYFPGRLPSIIALQDMIELAWDKGFSPNARIETGGIRLTRKYIGTPEAQALFQSLSIPCEAIAYSTTTQREAYLTLLDAILEYFDDGNDTTSNSDLHQVVITQKPPIYLQHRGHSLTIVGVEVGLDGATNLVVFDPMFSPSPSVQKLLDVPEFRSRHPDKTLKAFRRGEKYLSKYKDFEILKIRSTVM